MPVGERFDESQAIAARHLNVHDDRVDRVTRDEQQRLVGVGGADHFEAGFLQQQAVRLVDGHVVLDKKHALARGPLPVAHGLVDAIEQERHRRARAGRFDGDLALVAVHDVLHDGETEPETGRNALRGRERLEDVGQDRVGNPRAVVLHDEGHLAAAWLQRHRDRAVAAPERFPGVSHHVLDGELELVGVADNSRGGGEVELEAHGTRRRFRLERRDRGGDHRLGIDALDQRDTPAPLHGAPEAVERLRRHLPVELERLAQVAGQVRALREQRQVPEEGRERATEIVGEARQVEAEDAQRVFALWPSWRGRPCAHAVVRYDEKRRFHLARKRPEHDGDVAHTAVVARDGNGAKGLRRATPGALHRRPNLRPHFAGREEPHQRSGGEALGGAPEDPRHVAVGVQHALSRHHGHADPNCIGEPREARGQSLDLGGLGEPAGEEIELSTQILSHVDPRSLTPRPCVRA